MRIGIVADIHCNVEGLREALDRMGSVDELLCAGDAIFQHQFSSGVVALLRERRAHYVLGNHELTFLRSAQARRGAGVHAEALEYLASRPMTIDVQVSGKRLLMVHGSPIGPSDAYVYPKSAVLSRMGELAADYVILGHTHHAMAIRVGRTLVVNPGSAGDPRDLGNGLSLSFAVLDTASGEVRFESYPDPAQRWPYQGPAAPREWPVRGIVMPEDIGPPRRPATALPPWIGDV